MNKIDWKSLPRSISSFADVAPEKWAAFWFQTRINISIKSQMESLEQRQFKAHFHVGLFSQCGSTVVTAVDLPLIPLMPFYLMWAFIADSFIFISQFQIFFFYLYLYHGSGISDITKGWNPALCVKDNTFWKISAKESRMHFWHFWGVLLAD